MKIELCCGFFGIVKNVKTTNLNDWMRAWNTEMGEKNDSFWSYEHAKGYSREAKLNPHVWVPTLFSSKASIY